MLDEKSKYSKIVKLYTKTKTMFVALQLKRCDDLLQSKPKRFRFPPRGHSNMKVTYKFLPENKIGGVQCKISSKKGSFGVGTKKWGLFWCGLPKMGVIQCAKMQFQGKICKFSVKIATKSLNFSTRAKICHFHVKFDAKVEKKESLGVDWIKKGGHWV